MKKGIHPEYKTIKIIKTTGESFETKSCLGVKHAQYYLEIDPESHPAWSKQNRFTGPSIGNMKKFEKKYPGLEDLK
jgi:large subunit ribosomal protein L31